MCYTSFTNKIVEENFEKFIMHFLKRKKKKENEKKEKRYGDS
jgi:hypothetical protein